MKLRDIPVVTVGAGSQPAEADGAQLEYIRMPTDMARFVRPDIPEPEQVRHLTGAREAMQWLSGALRDYRPEGDPVMADITGLDAANRELVNQVLGEGEVSVTWNAGVRARVQESVLAGVWRTLYIDDSDRVTHDLIEVGDVPWLVRLPAQRADRRAPDLTAVEPPADVMNAMAILTEIKDRCESFRPDLAAHVINLTLLPLSRGDVGFLRQRLGRGPIDVLARGYGNCHVSGTSIPNVWWVRFYNSMRTLILDTIEVTEVPLVICAAPEDLADSAERLAEILEPYWSDLA